LVAYVAALLTVVGRKEKVTGASEGCDDYCERGSSLANQIARRSDGHSSTAILPTPTSPAATWTQPWKPSAGRRFPNSLDCLVAGLVRFSHHAPQ